VVTTPEGTQYRLGYTANSEQTVVMALYNPDACTLQGCPWDYWLRFGGYAGDRPELVAQRWSVDRVRDVHGNRMTYHYYEERRTEVGYDRAVHLDWIEYGGNDVAGTPARYRVQLTFEPRQDGNGRWHDAGTYGRQHFSLWEEARVHSIRVYANGAIIREVMLRYETPTLEHPGVEWGQLERPEITVLAAVQEYGRGGEAGGQALPAVTFNYAYLDQADDEWDRVDGGLLGSKLRYPRLVRVDNGYGGWVSFGYERLMSDHVNSYRVTEQWQGDGLGHAARTAYAYGEPCFAGWDASCRRGQDRNFALLGHTWAKETIYNYGGRRASPRRCRW
jgi:hypothetical protein